MSNITDNMIDLSTITSKSSSYQDFEGFADPKVVLGACKNPDTGEYVWDEMYKDDPNYRAIRALTLHYVHMSVDLGDVIPDFGTVTEMCAWMGQIVTIRWFSDVTDEQIREIEEQP